MRLPAPPVLKGWRRRAPARGSIARGTRCCARSRPGRTRTPWSGWWCATAPRRARGGDLRVVRLDVREAVARLVDGGFDRSSAVRVEQHAHGHRAPVQFEPQPPGGRWRVHLKSQNVGADDAERVRIAPRQRSSRPRGAVLLAADYSQIELRVLARLARDSRLLEISLKKFVRRRVRAHLERGARFSGVGARDASRPREGQDHRVRASVRPGRGGPGAQARRLAGRSEGLDPRFVRRVPVVAPVHSRDARRRAAAARRVPAAARAPAASGSAARTRRCAPRRSAEP